MRKVLPKPPRDLVASASVTLPENPHFRSPPTYQSDTAAASSATGTTTFTEKKLRNSLLRRSQFCAVTRSATESIQTCHVLNTVRRKKNETVEAARQRSFLSDLKILGRSPFLLNSIANALLLLPRIHTSWDKYASVMICPPLKTIEDLQAYFFGCNFFWDRMAKKTPETLPERPVLHEQSDGLLHASEFDFFVLRPATFLPYGETMSVCINPPHLDRTHPTISDDHRSIWMPHHYDPTSSKLVMEPPVTVTAEDEKMGDAPEPLKVAVHGTSLSTVAVIINASTKLGHAERNNWPLSAEVLKLKAAIDSFMFQFFYLPSASDASSPSKEGPTPRLMDDGEPLSDDRMQGSGSDREGSHGNQHDEADLEEEEEGEEFEEYEEEELEEEDDDEASRSLSAEEYRLGLKKVRDQSIPIKRRMEIAVLLLTKPYLPPPAHI
ncbi:hypothetical protein FB451DRAFT_1244441 [Mycena latifolia]|nr:hypothetical protein FB451DRAFT_1244441 [Mycena latifolia]